MVEGTEEIKAVACGGVLNANITKKKHSFFLSKDHCLVLHVHEMRHSKVKEDVGAKGRPQSLRVAF